MVNFKSFLLLASLAFSAQSAMALSEAECAYLKPVMTPQERAYCSQPGHNCITNPLPYEQCLREQPKTSPVTPPPVCTGFSFSNCRLIPPPESRF